MQSEQIDQLATALIKAQSNFQPVNQGKTARIPTESGGEYSYSYADLGDIVKIVSPTLKEYGLAFSQTPTSINGLPALTTILMHTSGQWISDTMLLHIDKDDAQGQRSAMTYARRYALSTLLGIVTETDDDGAKAVRTRREHAGVRNTARAGRDAMSKVALRTLAPATVGTVCGFLRGPAVGVAVFVAVLLVATRTRPIVPLRLALLLFPAMALLDVLHQPSRLDNVASYALMLLVVSLVLLWLDRHVQLPGSSAAPTPGAARRLLRPWSPAGTEPTPTSRIAVHHD